MGWQSCLDGLFGKSTPAAQGGQSPTPSAADIKGPLRGIDLSHHNDSVNLKAVKYSGKWFFVFLKSTQGIGFIDNHFKSRWGECGSVGLLRSAYHYFEPGQDGVAQAKHMLSVTGTLEKGDLPCVLDWESQDKVPRDTQVSRAKDFLDFIEGETGVTPIIYGGHMIREMKLGQEFARYPLWCANYQVSSPKIGTPWINGPGWTFWQDAEDGLCPGLPKGRTVDTDWFKGSLNELKALCKR